MSLYPISTVDVRRALDQYAVPVIMLWFLVRWFFVKAPDPNVPAPDKMTKATVDSAALGLAAAACVVGAFHWITSRTDASIAPTYVAAATAIGIAAGVFTRLASDLSLAAAGTAPWWRAAGIFLATAAGTASWVVYPDNHYVHLALVCGYMALLFGYLACCLYKDLK